MTMTQTLKTFRFSSLTATALLALASFQTVTALPATLEAQRATSEAPSKLTLNVTGYSPEVGKILVALYNEETSFDDETSPFRDAKVTINGATANVVFENLPVGEYAFKLFHDENDNGELDTDGLGIPSETYFFSTDASDPFSAPEWGESKFVLPAGKMVRDINLD